MVKRILIGHLLLAAILLAGCRNKTEEVQTSGYTLNGDKVHINTGHPLTEKIKVASTEEEMFTREIITAGTIQPISTQYAYIAPPFAGRISRSYISLGQKVSRNMPLFEIISPDFIDAQKEFFQAQSERELALKDMKRKEDLFKNGVAAERDLEEAVNMLKIAEKEYENAYAALQIYQVSPEDMVLGQPLVIRSPIDGHIIENNVVTGLYLKDDAEPVATIADVSQVWVTAQVKEKDLRFIHQDCEMDIHIPALPGKHIKGKVFHIDYAVDEETRSVQVLSVCDNRDNLLKLGMHVNIHFTDQPSPMTTVPEKALLQDEKMTFVFVNVGEDTYVKTPVEVEITKDNKAYISEGLAYGQKIITEGGYYLK